MAGDWSFGARKAPRNPILNILHNLAIFSKKQKKIAFLTITIRCKKNFSAEFSGRCGPATKAITGINTPYTCPQIPIILRYGPWPFLPICILKNLLSFAKRHFFSENVVFVVFVAFWVLRLLLFKIS